MKIAIDIREALRKKKAGKGWYTYEIVRALLAQDSRNHYILYTDSKENTQEWENFENAEMRIISGRSFFWHWKVARNIKKEKPDIFFAPTSFVIPALLPETQKTIITVHDLIAWFFPKGNNKKACCISFYISFGTDVSFGSLLDKAFCKFFVS